MFVFIIQVLRNKNLVIYFVAFLGGTNVLIKIMTTYWDLGFHIGKILLKENTRVLALVLLYENKKKYKETFQSVELCNI